MENYKGITMYTGFFYNRHEVGDTALQDRVVIREKCQGAGQIRHHLFHHRDDILKRRAFCQRARSWSLKWCKQELMLKRISWRTWILHTEDNTRCVSNIVAYLNNRAISQRIRVRHAQFDHIGTTRIENLQRLRRSRQVGVAGDDERDERDLKVANTIRTQKWQKLFITYYTRNRAWM